MESRRLLGIMRRLPFGITAVRNSWITAGQKDNSLYEEDPYKKSKREFVRKRKDSLLELTAETPILI